MRQLAVLALVASSLSAATVPTGFVDSQWVTGLSAPTAMAFSPDGRLFVCQQGGALRVIKNGQLLSTPFLTLTVNSSGERGLLGIAFDPNFATNQYLYVYYTATSPAIHNRISRFTANGDVALAGSELVILDLDNLSSATNHNGGAMHFGPDGKLYVAVGENATTANAQTLTNLLGKMLRINTDPANLIPADNPFPQATGNNRAIWALGLRNPFTFAFQPGTGVMFINDVGQGSWEEINVGAAGANYGWPATEGYHTNPAYVSPLFAYSHGSGPMVGNAITGGAFYNPSTTNFPPEYTGRYFFADYTSNWVRQLTDPAIDNAVAGFATGYSSPVDLKVGPDGALYVLNRGTGAVNKVTYAQNQPPAITTHPANATVTLGQTATFNVVASGTPPLSYQWLRADNPIPGATSASYTTPATVSGDNGAQFKCRVSSPFGEVTSNAGILTVVTNQPPVGTITSPAAGTLYQGGQTISFTGTATDPDQGTLPASAFNWVVEFHHDTHTHPATTVTAATGGSFTVPTIGETSVNVWFRITLTVTDSGGLTHVSTRDVFPRVSTITLNTTSQGAPTLQLTLDGQSAAPPRVFQAVVGTVRSIGAPSPQTSGGREHTFQSWSDRGAQTHNITIPAVNTTYTAKYRRR